jgi:hypothetical protein
MTSETEKTLFSVAVDCERCMGPHRINVTVVAEDEHEALDRAPEHPNASALYDEDIQRAIANGEINDHRVERKYGDYVEEIEYVGDLE